MAIFSCAASSTILTHVSTLTGAIICFIKIRALFPPTLLWVLGALTERQQHCPHRVPHRVLYPTQCSSLGRYQTFDQGAHRKDVLRCLSPNNVWPPVPSGGTNLNFIRMRLSGTPVQVEGLNPPLYDLFPLSIFLSVKSLQYGRVGGSSTYPSVFSFVLFLG
ncbi:unnamed protein product [Ectocarpus sp. 6 AP-2014]